MKDVLRKVPIMSEKMKKNPLSTFEREMEDKQFHIDFEAGYSKFHLSEILIDLMEDGHKTVRGLAEEVQLSPTIIQKIRSGKQNDLKVSNFCTIVEACGYHLFLKKGKKQIAL